MRSGTPRNPVLQKGDYQRAHRANRLLDFIHQNPGRDVFTLFSSAKKRPLDLYRELRILKEGLSKKTWRALPLLRKEEILTER